MKCLCFATFTRLFCACSASYKSKPAPIFEKMLLGYMGQDKIVCYPKRNNEVNEYTQKDMGKALNCNCELPIKLYEKCKESPVEWIEDYFQDEELASEIEDGKIKLFLAGLCDLIKNDKGIKKEDAIGSLSAAMFWDAVFNIPLNKILANVFWFCIRRRNNCSARDFYKEIDKDYPQKFLEDSYGISLYKTEELPSSSPLLLTSKEQSFNKSFIKLGQLDLGIPNENKLQVYVHPMVNRRFKYQELVNCLGANLAHYVFSRTKVKEIEDNQHNWVLIKAVRAYKSSPGFNREDLERELEKILIYLFLEQALKAPKIFSATEQRLDSKQSSGYGVHLHFSQGKSIQLIFGAAFVTDNIKEAIDSSIQQILEIQENEDDERKNLENSVFHLQLSDEQFEGLEKILIPQKENVTPPETAFGIFLGYTPNMLTDFPGNNQAYNKKINEAIIEAVGNEIEYINSLLLKNGLAGYSFYVFVVPFMNATDDKKKIIDEFLKECEV